MTLDMKEQTTLLDEFVATKPQKGKLFNGLIVSSFFYMAFVLINLAFDTQRLSPRRLDWQLGIFILLLPLLGIILHLSSKKIGWIINSFYYSLIALIMLYTLGWNILGDKNFHLKAAWEGLSLLALALISTVLLFSTSIRKYFNVSTLLFLIVVAISFGIAITMAITVLRD
jgi:hypothetical protein